MSSILRGWSVLLMIVVATALATSAAFADGQQTVTATLKLSIPFVGGKTALGTMVVDNVGTSDDIGSHWTFVGQVDGQPASASGTAQGHWTGSGYDGSIVSVDAWDMGGIPAPKLPLSMSLLTTSNETINTVISTKASGPLAVPLAVQGTNGLPQPFQGDLELSATNTTNSGEIQTLPHTGAAPDWMTLAATGAVVVGLGTLLAGARLAFAPRQSA